MNRPVTVILAAAAAIMLGAQSARAQSTRPYDGIQAGYDAWRLAEEQRRAAVADQLRLNDELKFWSGLPTSRGEVLSSIDYIDYYADPYLHRGYADFGYGYGGVPVVGPPGVSTRYGVSYARPLVRQPVGRVEVQTGPNRWESHPVYDPPLPDYRPTPPVDSPWLEGTPYASRRSAPEEESVSAPAAERPAAGAIPPPPVPANDLPPARRIEESFEPATDRAAPPPSIDAVPPPPRPTPGRREY